MVIRDLLNKIIGRTAVVSMRSDTYADADPLIDAYLDEAMRIRPTWQVKPSDTPAGLAILNADRITQVRVVGAAVDRMAELHRDSHVDGKSWWKGYAVENLYGALIVRNLPFSHADIVRLFDAYGSDSLPGCPTLSVLKQIDRFVQAHGISVELSSRLERMKAGLRQSPHYPDARKLMERIDQILGGVPNELPLKELVNSGEPFADAAQMYLGSAASELRRPWAALLTYAQTASSSKPSSKWLAEARKRMEAIEERELREQIVRWLRMVGDRRDKQLSDLNSAVVKGLVWCCSLLDDADVCRAVADCAESCFRKISWLGPRSVKAGNACIWALGAMAGMEPVAQLARLRLRVRYHAAQDLIQRTLAAAAERAGVSPEELEEMVVPSYGLEEGGALVDTLGGFRAESRVDGVRMSEWSWTGAHGRSQKSVPADLKQNHASEWKELKRTAGEIEKMLPAQRDRIERLLWSEREIDFPKWKERYLEHPLLSSMVGRLIWRFRSGDRTATGIRHESEIVDHSGRRIEWLGDDTEVRLWHPLGFDPQEVLAWRMWLENNGIVQPFKQAHREIYILTDAELATGTYSNRFAAHILKQHQLAALARQRGWRYSLQGEFDSINSPTLELPRWDLHAEFWVEGGMLADTTEMGIFLYVATDQVRFSRAHGPIPLTEVPATVFSEVMRDVDLFVGVSSVGADPNWRDTGDQEHRGYWDRYAFGELSGSANTRRDVLERLLPRLKINDRARLDGKFLIVRGDRRTYKIHLGSANILMEPNDQYLCIVPNRGSIAEKVFLPFEGDQTLAVILSKAFMLADDRSIKDPTILRQIGL